MQLGMVGLGRMGANIVRRINNTLRRADQIETSEGKKTVDWFQPIVADAEAGFGGVHGLLQGIAGRNFLALVRGPGPQTAQGMARGEIGVGLRRAHRRDRHPERRPAFR